MKSLNMKKKLSRGGAISFHGKSSRLSDMVWFTLAHNKITIEQRKKILPYFEILFTFLRQHFCIINLYQNRSPPSLSLTHTRLSHLRIRYHIISRKRTVCLLGKEFLRRKWGSFTPNFNSIDKFSKAYCLIYS